MPYWQLFYHLVWSTKNRQPLLTPLVEKHVYGYLTSKAVGLKGAVYAIGGTADHVHIVVAIPPAISVSRFVGQVKGVASENVGPRLAREETSFYVAEVDSWRAELMKSYPVTEEGSGQKC